MIHSMTGYGRAEAGDGHRKITVEMRSVNHRYLDLNIRLPRKLNPLESRIRKAVQEQVSRGKVDLFINLEDLADESTSLHYNETLAGEYLQYMLKMRDTFGLEGEIHPTVLARFPEVFTMEESEVDEEQMMTLLDAALQQALGAFLETRAVEGEHLASDLIAKLNGLSETVAEIEKKAPQIYAEYRERLLSKLKETIADVQIDENRLAAEMVLYTDKVCTDEEIVRLKAHIESMKENLSTGGESIGHKLDFIAQEMNRESNTILSKSKNIDIANLGITLKTEIEKIREQVQNIE